MEYSAGHILKADNVKLEGQFRLDVAHIGQGPAKGKTLTSATQQACIVESHPEFAVIEVTCSCGTKTHLRCEYTDAKPSTEASQTQNGTFKADSTSQNPANEGSGPENVTDQTKTIGEKENES
ncbi:MAG: hypothetical protein ACYS0C_00555 [Planctomycetota bacterium]|jgi:hypothetical protein